MITDECNYLKGRQNCSRSTPRRTKTVIRSSLVFGGESHLRLRPQIFRYNEENKNGLKVSLECFGVVENAIAKALPVGFRFHTLNESLTLMGNLPYQNRREVENTIKVDGLDSYEQLNRMLTEAYPQSVTTKYYCPLTIQVHSRDCYGDIDEDGYEEDAEFAARHEDDIRQALMEYNASDECNMAEYFHGNNGVSEKLRSADWDFERRNGELYGCITVRKTVSMRF